MRDYLIATIIALLAALFASGCQVKSNASAQPAHILVTNGYVYTADDWMEFIGRGASQLISPILDTRGCSVRSDMRSRKRRSIQVG
jgi:hypothetical protein